MSEQISAFPKTTMEVLESLRAVHLADVEKAATALDNLSDDEKIARRYEKAEEKLAGARELVRGIDSAIAELRDMEPTAEDAVRDMKRTAEEAGIGLSIQFGHSDPVVLAEKASVDPITGEVETPSVFVHYPDADDDVETEVGQYTTYGELIADYLTASGIDAEPGAYIVLDAEDGDLCPPTAQIAPEAYGRRYAVLPAPQTVESAA